jgi:uncharacterized membrane protein YbaN (DUF454 family)
MLSIADINTAIISQTWTNDQLTSMIDAVKFSRSRVAKQTLRQLHIGDPVVFNHKDGRAVNGIVTKIAIKFVTVKTNIGLWRVPASMLRIVERELA